MKPRKLSAIIKITESCNYNCEFCFYAKNNCSQNKIIDFSLLKNIMLETVKYNVNNNIPRVTFIFHGGEPLLAEIDFFKKIILYENFLKKNYPELIIDNCIQTNAFLINNEWIDFFEKNQFSVGISLDGPAGLNSHFICKESEDIPKIISTYNLLNAKDIDVGILSVITSKHTQHVNEFYEFIVENKIKNIGLLPCVNDEQGITITNNEYFSFMSNLFDLYFNSEYEFNVREFNIAIERVLGSKRIVNCSNCQRMSCGSYLTYDINGRVFYCDTAYNKATAIANFPKQSLNEIVSSKSYLEKKASALNFIESNCKNCDCYKLCGGACYRNDIKIDGIVKNRFCEFNKQFSKYVEEKVMLVSKELYL
ncbi:MAG: radical SAM protein [Clostridia bacterium]